MTEITLKKGNGKPSDSALVEAEFALDVDSGKIYSKLADGKVRALNDAEFIGVDTNADNYQYWQYKINGFNTTSVMSTASVNFQSGDGIEIEQSGYGIKISSTDSGSGAGMVISATEPSDPVDGMQWLESTTAMVWIWDEDKWLEFPAGKGGSDSNVTYTLPVTLRSGDAELPLNADSTKLEVITRAGPIELPLLAA
jgi:hypothetical protein